MNCKSCGSSMPDDAVSCARCGEDAVKRAAPARAGAPGLNDARDPGPGGGAVQFTLVLDTIWDGREEDVAARLSSLTKKDMATAMGYLDRLPLTLGRKFNEEKARQVKGMIEEAGGVVAVTPPFEEAAYEADFGPAPSGVDDGQTYDADGQAPEDEGAYGSFGSSGIPEPYGGGAAAEERPAYGGYGDATAGGAGGIGLAGEPRGANSSGAVQGDGYGNQTNMASGPSESISMVQTERPKPSGGPRPGPGSRPGGGYGGPGGPSEALTQEEEIACLVNKNYEEKYRRKFRKFEDAGGFAATWHWPCFFLGFWWFLYRKMYLWAAVDFFAGFFLSILIMPVRGVLGNFLYWRHLKGQSAELRREYRTKYGGSLDQSGYRAFLETSGGTSGIVWVAAPLILIFVVGILAAIAIPNFLKYQSKAKQVEAKTNLASISKAQDEFFTANGRYAVDFEELGWTPTSNNQGGRVYSYFLSPTAVIPGDEPVIALPEGVVPMVETFDYRAVAAGNIDSDPTLDVWVTDDSGKPSNTVDDVRE